jgi:hypothetical protein
VELGDQLEQSALEPPPGPARSKAPDRRRNGGR